MLNLSVPQHPNTLLSTILVFLALLHLSRNLNVTVTPASTVISEFTTYEWNITDIKNDLINSSNYNCTFYFPSDAKPNSTTKVIGPDNVTYNITSQLVQKDEWSSISISTTINSSSIVFQMTNILNPSTPMNFNFNISINDTDDDTATFQVVFISGTITNCSVNFSGVTRQTGSTATLSFHAPSPTPKYVKFSINYYSAYGKTLSSFDSSNVNALLQIKEESDILTNCSSALNYFIISCTFNVTLPGDANITLILGNVNNPPVTEDYLSNFRISTVDSQNTVYDSGVCKLNPVAPETHIGTFNNNTGYNISNTGYNISSLVTNPIVTTNVDINISGEFNSGDYINITTNGIFFSYTQNMSLKQPQNPPITYYIQNNSNSILTKCNNNIIDAPIPGPITFNMTGWNFTAPHSAAPVTVTFKCLTSSQQQYMEINAIFQALPIRNATNITLNINDSKIGNNATYTFDINISQELGPTSFVLIYFPSQINLSQSNYTCYIEIPNLNTSCTISAHPAKPIEVNITSNSTIPGNSSITLEIDGIINPIDPTQNYSFGFETYYKQGDYSSLVQSQNNITGFEYTPRNMSLQKISLSYMVNQSPAQLILMYFPGINIPQNSVLTIQFTNNVKNLQLRNILMNDSNYTPINNTSSSNPLLINLTLPNSKKPITAATNFTLNFTFTAPSGVASYKAIQYANLSYKQKQYQVLELPLYIDVTTAITSQFTIIPLSAKTGAKTSYSFLFYTIVDMSSSNNSFFFLVVDIPQNVSFNNVSTTCLSAGNCSYSFTSSQKTIWIKTTKQNTSNGYNVTLSGFTNPRKIGQTQSFGFKIVPQINGSQIIQGNGTATISSPNLITAQFSKQYQYYRNNSNPIFFNVTFTNKLQQGDCMRIYFDNRTYRLNEKPLTCNLFSNGFKLTCNNDSSLPSTTVIQLNFTNEIVNFSSPITFEIGGLTSSDTTFYTQSFPIPIKTFTSQFTPMDQGSMTYNISCGTSLVLITKTCQTCNSNNSCESCYDKYYLLNGTCVTDCPSASQYTAFTNTNSTSCTDCINGCDTCISANQCLTCVKAFNYLYEDSRCLNVCDVHHYSAVVRVGNTLQTRCIACWDLNCRSCLNGNSTSCVNCSSGILKAGECVTANKCDLTIYYIVDNTTCLSCDPSCYGCYGTSSQSCKLCRPGYYNYSGNCTNECPLGTLVRTDKTCGCLGQCRTCSKVATHCESCLNDSLLLYNYQCVGSCPEHTYNDTATCADCGEGCESCSIAMCFKCLSGYNVHQNKCYTDCKTFGYRYVAINSICIECPEGCNMCSSDLICSMCISNYTLAQGLCTLTCKLHNNCTIPDPVPTRKLPLPGFLAASTWLIMLGVLKLTVAAKMYLPYAYLFMGSLIEYILVIVVLVTINKPTPTLSVSRLLSPAVDTPPSHHFQHGILGLLIVSIILNYLSNLIYLRIFCKYLLRSVSDRQIDKISNYVVLVVGTITNYRFFVIAYSKLFPKPNILIDHHSKLTPLHYMCIGSLVGELILVATAGILIYNEIHLTNLFMMGIDLLAVALLDMLATMWIVAVEKSEGYFQCTKKYAKEEQFNPTKNVLGQESSIYPNASNTKLCGNINMVGNSLFNHPEIDESILIEKKLTKVDSITIGQQPIHQQTIQDIDALTIPNNTTTKKQSKHCNKSDNENQPLPNVIKKISQPYIDPIKIQPQNSQPEDSLDEVLAGESDIQQQRLNPKYEATSHSYKTSDNNRPNKTKAKHPTPNKPDKPNPKKPGKAVEDKRVNEPEEGIKMKVKESVTNFSKEKKPIKAKFNKSELHASSSNQLEKLSPRAKQNLPENQLTPIPHLLNQDLQQCFADDFSEQTMKQISFSSFKKQKKPQKLLTQRSSDFAMPPIMKKKTSFGMLDSQSDPSQLDPINFDELIKSKIIDKTNENPTDVLRSDENGRLEELSPSLFNAQNQRFESNESKELDEK